MTRASLFLPGLALTTILLGTSTQLTSAGTEEISQSFTQQAGFEKQFQSPRTTHTTACAHSATPEDHSRIGIVFSTIQDFEGWLPFSPAPDKIIPSSTPPNYNLSAVISYNYGVSLYYEGKVVQGEKEWQTALDLQPTLPEAHYAMSYLAHLRGDSSKGILHGTKAWRYKSDWPAAAYLLGLLEYQGGNFSKASQLFQEALQLQPQEPLAINGLGMAKLREGHVPDAGKAFSSAIAWNPNAAYAHMNLGLVFLVCQQWEKAGEQFTRTLQFDPSHERTFYWMGITQAASGQWAQAISSWQRFLALARPRRDFDRVYYNLGTAYWMAGNPREARKAYQAALHLQPAWPQLSFQLGVIEMVNSQWDKAADYFLQASHLAPDWDQPYFNLGMVRYNQGLVQEARNAFQEVVNLHSNNFDGHYYLGLTLRILRQDKLALPAFQFAAQFGHTGAQEMLAGMYAHGRGTPKNLTEAMRWWYRATRHSQGGQPADHARAQLSRLRQLYFLYPDTPAFTQEIDDGFHMIRQDIWQEEIGGHGALLEKQGNSAGITLASYGSLRDAVPLLIREAYALSGEAHQYLEGLIREGVLTSTSSLYTPVMEYFRQTAAEGSRDSCRFLSMSSPFPELNFFPGHAVSRQPSLCSGMHE